MYKFLTGLLVALLVLTACAAAAGDTGGADRPDAALPMTDLPAETAPVTKIIPETVPEPRT